MRRMGALALTVLALGSFVVACGDDGKETTASGGGSSETTEAPAKAQQVKIGTAESGTDTYKFTDVPTTLKAGVATITLDNSTGKDPHDFQLAKLAAGHTPDELAKCVNDEQCPFPTWIEKATGVGTAGPAHTSDASVKLTPGTWVYFCTESTDKNNGQSISHAQHGMLGTVEVSGTSGPALPKATAKIDAAEYHFTPTGLKAGANTVEFHNSGKMFHHVLVLPIAAGKTFDEVKAAFSAPENQQSGPPPVDFEKGVGTSVISPGDSLVTEWNLAAGKYVMICFMPDPGTAGPPHVAKGMLQELDIS